MKYHSKYASAHLSSIPAFYLHHSITAVSGSCFVYKNGICLQPGTTTMILMTCTPSMPPTMVQKRSPLPVCIKNQLRVNKSQPLQTWAPVLNRPSGTVSDPLVCLKASLFALSNVLFPLESSKLMWCNTSILQFCAVIAWWCFFFYIDDPSNTISVLGLNVKTCHPKFSA